MAVHPGLKTWSKEDIKSYSAKKRIARRDLRALVKALDPVVLEAQTAHPDNPKRQARFLKAALKERGDVLGFVDKWVGPDSIDPKAYSWRNRTMDMIRDVSLGTLGANKAFEKLEGIMILAYRASTLGEVQEPLKDAIPEELRAFLPDNLVVVVDEDGNIQEITDRFVAQKKTFAKKIKVMRDLLQRYNSIVAQVKKDIKSGDPITRLAALVTAIIMETGIRPGQRGNVTLVRDPVTGEKVPVDTFGAVTLGPNHVRFIRDEFAELEFVGKASSTNLASLSDSAVIKILKSLVENAQKSGSKFIFVTPNGREFTKKDLNRYFGKNFKGISPTDFRQLRATDVMFEQIRKAQLDLYAEIQEYIDLEESALRDRVVTSLVKSLNQAIDEAQKALSHDKDSTTVGSYINPQILLRFFSQGRAADSLKEALMDGAGELSFDPMKFVEMAKASASKVARRYMVGTAPTLRDLLEEIEEAEQR